MFRCELCGRQTLARQPAEIIVVETREKSYPPRGDANRVRRDGWYDYTDDSGGKGFETVKELRCCDQHRVRTTQDGSRAGDPGVDGKLDKDSIRPYETAQKRNETRGVRG